MTTTPTGLIIGLRPQTQTDANGRFAIARLAPGPEYISAFKETEFYPQWLLGTSGPGSISIDLPKGGAILDIVLQVLPGARLKVRAINAITCDGIDSIDVHIEREEIPDQ